jgi:hypothetical protein
MSKIRLFGTSSGYVEIAPAAAASNNTLTAPSTVGEIIAKDAAGAIGITSMKASNVNVGAAVTITESGIEASGIGITCANINGGKIGGRRNLIINGAMNLAQRGTSSTDDGYLLDRFNVFDGSSLDENVTRAQVDVASGTTPYTLGFRKALRLTNGNQTSGAQGNSNVQIMHKIEAQDIANSGWNYTSASSFITLQFWVKSSVAQNFYVYLRTHDGTGQRYAFETGSLSADTWTKVTKTISGNSNLQFDNNVDTGLEINISPYWGTNYTDSGVSLNAWAAYASGTRTQDYATTWFTTNDATFEITGVQLEVGPEATPFEHRSFGEELILCSRYYQKLSGDALSYYGVGNIDGANQAQILIDFVTDMRASPSSLETSGTAGDYFIRVTTNATCTSVPTLSNRTTKNALVEFRSTSHGYTSGQSCFGRRSNVSDSFLAFSSEL